jgi:hypothetical protein
VIRSNKRLWILSRLQLQLGLRSLLNLQLPLPTLQTRTPPAMRATSSSRYARLLWEYRSKADPNQDNSESGLLKLPNEIKLRIWTLAVTVDEPITPFQLRNKSNKFVWSIDQIDKKTHEKVVSRVPQLTAVQLAQTCRQLYQEVAATQVSDVHGAQISSFRCFREVIFLSTQVLRGKHSRDTV